jgi:hypothetical protein
MIKRIVLLMALAATAGCQATSVDLGRGSAMAGPIKVTDEYGRPVFDLLPGSLIVIQ